MLAIANVHGVGARLQVYARHYEIGAHHCAQEAAKAHAAGDFETRAKWHALADRYELTWRMKQWEPKRSENG